MTLLADLAIRSSVLLALGLLLHASLSKRSAALRHRVLTATVLAVVLVVPFSLALPAWNVPLPAADERSDGTSRVLTAAPREEPVAPTRPSADRAPTRTSQDPATSWTVFALVLIWLAGVFAAAGSLAWGLAHVRRIAARAIPVDDERWIETLAAVARRYGLARRIVLARTDSEDFLATWGVVRPRVLLPRHADAWAPDRMHVVLSHELAHVRRLDWFVQMAAEAVRAVLWFNPFAWMVCSRLRRESEQACDDEVLGAGVGGSAYAAHLLELARQCRRPRAAWTAALPMAHPSTLERRIAAMLNPLLDRRVPSRRVLSALGALLLLVTVPLAAIRTPQAGPAPLTGTVYDVTGAVLPGVDVSLTDANKVTTTAISGANGRFEFPAVAPGTYVLAASLVGFRSLRPKVELRQPGDWDRAIMLQVGGLSEAVSVQATRLASPPRKVPGFAPQAPVRVGGDIRPPKKIRDVKPIYPPSMREAGRTGLVIIDAIIGTDGAVSSIRVLSAQAHPDLAVAAVDAVRQWLFTPTLLNGAAIEVVMTVTVRFDLEG